MHLHLDPLLVSEGGPDVMGLSDCGLVRFQNHLGPVIVDMKCSEDQDESGESLEMGQTTKQTVYTGNKTDVTN